MKAIARGSRILLFHHYKYNSPQPKQTGMGGNGSFLKFGVPARSDALSRARLHISVISRYQGAIPERQGGFRSSDAGEIG